MFRYIVLAHIIISLGFFVFTIKPRGLQESIFRFVIVFFLPVFGILYFIITVIINRAIKSTDENIQEYIDYIEDLSHIHYVKEIDFDKEMNIVPAEDSLRFNEKKTRRSYIIYILKKDFVKHIDSLKKALENEDGETAHYAAAALMDIKNQFEDLLASSRARYERSKQDIGALQEYIRILRKYIKSGLPEKSAHKGYMVLYSGLLEEMLSVSKESKSFFIDKIDADIGLQRFKDAQKYCHMFKKSFPNEADPLLMQMKLDYYRGDKESLLSTLRDIRSSRIPLESKEKDIISFWEGRGISVH